VRLIYWIIGVVVVGLCIAGLIAFKNDRENERAQELARELTQKLVATGEPVPDQDILVRLLGDDGGAVCDNAEEGLDGLNKAIVYDQFVNGADFVGRRPIIADRRLVDGQLLILDTYCPEQLEEFRDELDELEYDDIIRD